MKNSHGEKASVVQDAFFILCPLFSQVLEVGIRKPAICVFSPTLEVGDLDSQFSGDERVPKGAGR